MENSEIQQETMIEKNEIVIDSKSLSYLKEIRKWTMFFAILGFIAIGFMLLGAIIMGVIGLVGSGFAGTSETWIFGVIAIVYIIFGGLYFFPVLYLLKFSTNMKTAIEQFKQDKMVLAFENLKSHYRFLGIVTIVMFSLYVLAGIIAVMVGISSII